MRKLFIAALIIAATFTAGLSQNNGTTPSNEQLAKLAHAPSQADGLGRAVVIVTDRDGNAVRDAYIKLDSTWGGDNFCESWGSTNSNGAIALNPIHMGSLKLTIKAKGYQTQKLEVQASSLNEPVRVTLTAKK